MNTVRSFKFIHAADLHLDSPFRTRAYRTPQLREVLVNASLEAFGELCQLAIAEKVDFIVLAGDIYDGSERGIRAQLRFMREVSKLAEHDVSVFAAFGNHDPMGQAREVAFSELPNLYTFPEEPKTYSLVKDGEHYASITGISYKTREEARNLAVMFPEADPKVFSLAVLHANIGMSADHGNYAPASLDDLLSKRYDYWALGHIHKRTVLCEQPVVLYPGNMQGRHFKMSETGPKGAEFVTVTTSGISHLFVPLAPVYFQVLDLDITGCTTVDSILESCIGSIEANLDASGIRPLVVKIQLSGTIEEAVSGSMVDIDALRAELQDRSASFGEGIFVEEVILKAHPAVSLDDLSHMSDVVQELASELQEWKSDESRLAALRISDFASAAMESRLRRGGLEGSLEFNNEDLEQAASLLAELLLGVDIR